MIKISANITSNQNKYIKQVNALKMKKERDKTNLFVIEGERIVFEIPDSWYTEYIIVSESYSKSENISFEKFSDIDVFCVPDELFIKISDTVSPQGILAVCRQKEFDFKEIIKKENPFFVMLERVCDPGNLGTIIRTADAAGADGVLLSKGCVDLYNNKVIRATMGSIFHLPIICNLDFVEVCDELKQNNISMYAAHLKGNIFPYGLELTKGSAILIGNEANGLSDEISDRATKLVKIPMPGMAESMNASIAGSIFIYEVVRQRI